MTVKALVLSFIPELLKLYRRDLKTSPVYHRLLRGTFWNIVGTFISRGISLIAFFCVARFLGKEAFGALGIIQSTIGMFGVFAGFGMGLTATKHVAEFRQTAPERAGHIIVLSSIVGIVSGILMAILLFAFSPWLATKTLAAPTLLPLIRVSSLLLLFNAINGAQTGALAGLEAFKSIARVNMYSGIFSFPLIVGGAYIGGLTGSTWALVLSASITCLMNHFYLQNESTAAGLSLRYRGSFREWEVLWRFSLPAVLSAAMIGPVNWICNAILVNQPNGYSEMGIYNAANQWFAVLIFLPNIVAQAGLPVLSERISTRGHFDSSKILSHSMKLNLFISLPIIFVGILISPIIMGFYGKGFGQGWPTLIIVMLTGGLLSIQIPVGNMIAALGKMWLGCIMNLGWGTIFIITTLVFVRMGAFGIASARALAYLIHAVWTLSFAYWTMKNKRAALV